MSHATTSAHPVAAGAPAAARSPLRWTLAWLRPGGSRLPGYRARLAITIADDWQGRGLRAELLTRLSNRARSAGICRFTALVDEDSMAIAGLLRKAGANLARCESTTVEYQITLVPRNNPDHRGCRQVTCAREVRAKCRRARNSAAIPADVFAVPLK